MTTLIQRLWADEYLPIQDGLYRADGTAYGVKVDATAPGGLEILQEFSLEDFLSPDPEMTTAIITTLEKPLENASGYVFCGEGGYGSEGYFGLLDSQRNLVWVVYLEDCNPFIDALVAGSIVTFRSSSEVVITVDLEAPEFRM